MKWVSSGVAVAVDLQEDVLHPRRRAAVEGRVDERADDVPDLRPALRGRLPHRPRVLGAEDRPRGVVVDLDVVRPPPEEELEAVDQEHPHHGAEGERPGRDGADRRRRPVDGAHQRAHLAAARQTVLVLVWGLHRKDPAPGRFIPVPREASFYPTEPAPEVRASTGIGISSFPSGPTAAIASRSGPRIECRRLRNRHGEMRRNYFRKTCTPLSDAYEPARIEEAGEHGPSAAPIGEGVLTSPWRQFDRPGSFPAVGGREAQPR